MSKDEKKVPSEAEDLIRNTAPALTDRIVKDTAYHHPHQPYQVIQDGRILEKPFSPSGYLGEFIDNNGREKTLKERTKVHRVSIPPIGFEGGRAIVWQGEVLVHGFMVDCWYGRFRWYDERGILLGAINMDPFENGNPTPAALFFPHPQHVERVLSEVIQGGGPRPNAVMFVEYFD